MTPILTRGVVSKETGGYSLRLSLRDSAGERSRHLGAPTCEELAHAAALIVALAIDPTLLEPRASNGDSTAEALSKPELRPACHCRITDLAPPQPPPPIVIRSPCPAAAVVVPPQTQIQARSSTEENPPLFWRIGVGALGAYAILPGLNLGLSLRGGMAWRRLRVDVAASTLNATVQLKTLGRNAELSLQRIGPQACGNLVTATNWAVGPCTGVELGILSGEGYGAGLANHGKQYALWLASSFGGRFEYRLFSSSLLLLSAELVVPWIRQDGFSLAGEIVQSSKVSSSFGASLLAGWP